MTDPIDCTEPSKLPHHGKRPTVRSTPKNHGAGKPLPPLKKQLTASAATTVSHAEQKQCNTNRNKRSRRLGTVEDLARRWKLAPKTLSNNLSSGRLKLGTRVLGHVRFDIAEVLEYERANRISNRKCKDKPETKGGGDK